MSVSLPPDDVEFLDDYARREGFDSRSAVLQKAVTLLRSAGLADAYANAWQDWDDSGETAAWDAALPDGL